MEISRPMEQSPEAAATSPSAFEQVFHLARLDQPNELDLASEVRSQAIRASSVGV